LVVDREEISANLTLFYDFRGKAVLYVGAGRGQLLGPDSGVSRVVAIDRDGESLRGFRLDSKTKWAGIPIRFIPSEFETVAVHGDVVYLEFCLHQMQDPTKALEHAHSLAPDVVVMDHLPWSKWVYYWAGEDLVRRSTKALESFGIRRRKEFATEQRFDGWEALATRLADEGEESKRRVLELKGAKEMGMRMDYGLFLL
jgi:hypothetical protein